MPFPESTAVRAGRFTTVRPLAGGAHGRVYLAHDNLGRTVAVKEALPDDTAFAERCERFRTEARVQAALQHPAIVPVYQLEEDTASGELYLVCAYADGGSLADRLRRGPLSAAEVMAVARDIGSALEATWALRIVHRDVKPANILLFGEGPASEAGTWARLGDFGVAQDQRRRRTTLLPSGGHPGTPLYMAPEQANAANLLDVRTDIYALAVSLWEALTGEDYKLLAAAGPPDLARLRPDVPAALGPALAGGLAEDRDERYRDPRELARAIELALTPRPAHIRETIDLARQSPADRGPLSTFVGDPSARPSPAVLTSPAEVAALAQRVPVASPSSAEEAPPLAESRRPRAAAVVNALLVMLALVLWVTLPMGARSATLVVGLPLFLTLLFLRRERRTLAQRATLAVGAFAVCIGLFRAFVPGDALSSAPNNPLPQLLGLLLTLGAALWVGAALSTAHSLAATSSSSRRRRE